MTGKAGSQEPEAREPGGRPGTAGTALRRAFLGLLAFGCVGTGLELVLLGHTEGFWQILPLVQFGLAVGLITWHIRQRSQTSLRALQALMLLFVASGITGLWLHYRGNVEFELEMYPSLDGIELFWKAITGATPALAPGTMILFGLMGLAGVWNPDTTSSGARS